MKYTIHTLFILFAFAVVGCQTEAKTTENEVEETDYVAYGDENMTANEAVSAEEAMKSWSALNVGDSTQMKVKTTINEVCQQKGCWVTLDLGNGESAKVKFKDYAFFVPKDVSGRTAVVNGWAHREEVSVDELKHHLEDAGKPQEEIDAITEPEVRYTFVADGVLIESEA